MDWTQKHEEFESLLPVYETRRAATQGLLIVTCPRVECGGTFSVKASFWFAPKIVSTTSHGQVTIYGRPCPYCAKVSSIPTRRR